MKLIHAILGAGAASLLPTALAQEPASQEARPFAISISSEVRPVAELDLRYPAQAGMQGLEGSCDVTFAVSPAGEADAIRVGFCTSEVFRRAAKSTVEQMRFAPRTTTLDGAQMRIKWAFEQPQLQTASLQ
jgi:TonB family protein